MACMPGNSRDDKATASVALSAEPVRADVIGNGSFEPSADLLARAEIAVRAYLSSGAPAAGRADQRVVHARGQRADVAPAAVNRQPVCSIQLSIAHLGRTYLRAFLDLTYSRSGRVCSYRVMKLSSLRRYR